MAEASPRARCGPARSHGRRRLALRICALASRKSAGPGTRATAASTDYDPSRISPLQW
nr:hypothetical protein [Streptomyces sp. TLI_235]